MPDGVDTESRPPIDASGTAVFSVVAVADMASAVRMFSVSRLFAGVVSKFVPEIVNGVPATPMAGEKPVIVGAPVSDSTVNADPLVAAPGGAATLIGPVIAPAGTTTASWLGLADVMAAAVPLNE